MRAKEAVARKTSLQTRGQHKQPKNIVERFYYSRALTLTSAAFCVQARKPTNNGSSSSNKEAYAYPYR